jgi:hypothetical protein
MMSMLKRTFKHSIARLLLAGTLVMDFSEPLISRRPWFAALLVATLATPAAVVIAWLAPRPLDAVVALPLVLIDMWAAPAEGPILRLLLLLLGILLTWLLYLVVARLVFWRLADKSS